MLPVEAIKATVEGMKKAQAEADKLRAALTAEVEKISNDKGRTLDYIDEKVKEAREKAVPGIYEQLNIINGEAERLTKTAAPYWGDAKFVLSREPLTAASKDNPSLPADIASEAISRLARLTELAKMDEAHLHMTADSAIQEDRHGELYLISLESDSRAGKPGWSPIDLDKIKLPERDKALSLLNEARKMAGSVSSQIGLANGRPLTSVEKLSAARAAA